MTKRSTWSRVDWRRLKADYEVIEEIKGSELEGLRYHGPFDELPAQEGVEHRVILWDEVSESDGTGLVHSAPGAGEEDYALSKEYDLPAIAPLDEFGKFVDGFGELTGLSVFEVARPIYRSLREKGTLYRLDQITHRYPVCWRCDTELVFRLVDEWFISMDELRHQIAEVTKKITWIPDFGMGRELDWLRNMDDWMISKKRYYGLALPIYKCQECGHFEVIGSEVELKERAVEGWDRFEGHSPHRPMDRRGEDSLRGVRGRPSRGSRTWATPGSMPASSPSPRWVTGTTRTTGGSGSRQISSPRASPDSSATGSTRS